MTETIKADNTNFETLANPTTRRSFDGRTYDRYVSDLSGAKAFKTYEDMALNDSTYGGILLAVEMLIRNVRWWVEPASQKPKDLQAAQFLEECRQDMSDTWEDMVSEVLTMLVHGWSYHEIIYKYRGGQTGDGKTRSKFNDNLIGWRKWPIVSQDSLTKWIFDDDGGVAALVQGHGDNEVIVPIEKSLLFRTKPNRRSPEGQSILRKAYRPWYFKRRMEEIEGIGVERELAGLPVMTAPEGLNIWDSSNEHMVKVRNAAEGIIKAVRENRAEGILKPYGWEFTLASTGGQRAIEVGSVIERWNRQGAMSMLADFITLGHESVGSFALADVKTNLFAYAIGAWLDVITQVIQRYAIPRLFALNQKFPQDRHPTLMHGDTETPDLTELADYISKLTGSGIIIPGQEIEDHLRQLAGLPPRPDEPKPGDPLPQPAEKPDPKEPGKDDPPPSTNGSTNGSTAVKKMIADAVERGIDEGIKKALGGFDESKVVRDEDGRFSDIPGVGDDADPGGGPGSAGFRSFGSPAEGTKWGQKHFGSATDWFNQLSPETMDDLQDYTGETYEPYNAHLRKGAEVSEGDKKAIEGMADALREAVIPEDIEVFRSWDDPELADAIEYDEIVPESIYDPGFLSTSTNKGTGSNLGAFNARIRIPKGTRGAHVGDLSQHPSENEVLLPPGNHMKVLDMQPTDPSDYARWELLLEVQKQDGVSKAKGFSEKDVARDWMGRFAEEFGGGFEPIDHDGKGFKSFSPDEGTAWGNKHFGNGSPWDKTLSDTEIDAIGDYTFDGYQLANDHERHGSPLSDDEQVKHDALKDAIKRAEIPENIEVYRSFTDDDLMDLLRDDMAIGATVSDKGFVSTSLDENRGSEKHGARINSRILVPKGTKGAHVANLSKFPDENEVILAPGVEFEILDAHENDPDEKDAWFDILMKVVGQK